MKSKGILAILLILAVTMLACNLQILAPTPENIFKLPAQTLTAMLQQLTPATLTPILPTSQPSTATSIPVLPQQPTYTPIPTRLSTFTRIPTLPPTYHTHSHPASRTLPQGQLCQRPLPGQPAFYRW